MTILSVFVIHQQSKNSFDHHLLIFERTNLAEILNVSIAWGYLSEGVMIWINMNGFYNPGNEKTCVALNYSGWQNELNNIVLLLIILLIINHYRYELNYQIVVL